VETTDPKQLSYPAPSLEYRIIIVSCPQLAPVARTLAMYRDTLTKAGPIETLSDHSQSRIVTSVINNALKSRTLLFFD